MFTSLQWRERQHTKTESVSQFQCHSVQGEEHPSYLPVQTLLESFAFCRAAFVYGPLTVFEFAQPEFLAHLALIQCAWQILLVSKNEQLRVFELFFREHGEQFCFCCAEPFCIRSVNHVDDGRCVGIVASPIRPAVAARKVETRCRTWVRNESSAAKIGRVDGTYRIDVCPPRSHT